MAVYVTSSYKAFLDFQHRVGGTAWSSDLLLLQKSYRHKNAPDVDPSGRKGQTKIAGLKQAPGLFRVTWSKYLLGKITTCQTPNKKAKQNHRAKRRKSRHRPKI